MLGKLAVKVICLTSFIAVGAFSQAPVVTSHTPVRNALNQSKSVDLTVTFSQDMDVTTFTNGTIRINGSLSVLNSSTFSYDVGTRTVTVTPSASFMEGEVVAVVLTRGIKSAAGDSLASALAWGFTIQAGTGPGEFIQSATVAVGGGPEMATAGDFDGDGDIDHAVVNGGTHTVSVLLNNGGGTFTLSSTVTVGNSPRSATAGDIDGDGDLDLAVANRGANTVTVLSNNGSGVFTQSSLATAGSGPFAIAAGDYDEDGDLDYAVTNCNSNTVSILMNDGGGAFTQSSTTGVGDYPESVVAGDYNGDGDLDLAVTNLNSNNVFILMNNGSGAFTLSSAVAVGNKPQFFSAGDFDGDGDLDLAVPNTHSHTVSILTNNGSGVFAPGSTVGVGTNSYPCFVTVGDCDGDGDLDLFTANNGWGNVSILMNNGSGAFTQSSAPAVGGAPTSAAAADMDGDGDIDLAVTNWGSNTVSILMNAYPHIMVTSPDGGESWHAGSVHAITWTSLGTSGTVKIEYSTDSGSNWTTIASSAPDNGNYSWTIPEAPSTTCLIKVSDTTGSPTDQSDATFTMSPIAFITLTAPNGGEDWKSGKVYDITWTSSGTSGTVEIEFSTDSGSSWTTVTSSSLDDGTYSWTIPELPSTTCLVKVSDTAGSPTDQSDAVFSLIVPPSVISFSPASNALNVNQGINITASFSQDMDETTLTNGTVRIHGALSGLHACTFSYDPGTRTVTMTPMQDFEAGEAVSVTLTRDIQAMNGDSLKSAVVWGFQVAVESATDGTFRTASVLTPGTSPHSVCAGDLDGDGDPDLAVANFESDNVSILLNDGAGAFTPSSTAGTGNGSYSVVTGDWDEDGDLDLAVSNYYDASVSVLLNAGDGTFTPGSTAVTGNTPYCIALGDFDGDGDLDLSTSDYTDGSISVLLNNGAGTFTRNSSHWTEGTPQSVAAGDFDGDGDIDLVTANYGYNTVAVFLNDGKGIMVRTYIPPAGGNHPLWVAAGDFDGDGDLDCASANGFSNKVSILQNPGNGSLVAVDSVAVGSYPKSVVAADLDGDGDLDLITANDASGTVSILLNDGHGSFMQASAPAVGANPQIVAGADFNGDGDLDLAVVNGGSNTVSILKNVFPPAVMAVAPARNSADNGKASDISIQFTRSVDASTLTASSIRVNGSLSGLHTAVIGYDPGSSTAVINPDTDFCVGELVSVTVTTGVTNTGGDPLSSASSWTFSVQARKSGGLFNATVNAGSMGNNPYSIVAGDWNRDGALDISMANYGSNSFTNFSNNGSGTFTYGSAYGVGSFPAFIVSGDWNQNAIQDLIIINSSTPSTISIATGNGTGGFSVGSTNALGYKSRWVCPADYNGDGSTDIAVADESGNAVRIYMNNGSGGFSLSSTVGAGGATPYSLAAGDWNNDGWFDLATANYNSNSLSVLMNNGTGGFTVSATIALGSHPYSIAQGDWNGDGAQDLAVTNNGANTVSILRNNGTGGFSVHSTTGAGTPTYIHSADLNGDTYPDLAVAQFNYNSVAVLINNKSGGFTAGSTLTVQAGPMSIETGDWNNDGLLDLATVNVNSGIFSINMNRNDIAPTGLAAVEGNEQVSLRWKRSTGIDIVKYRIYGGTSANPVACVDSTTGGIGDTTKVVTGLTNNTVYYFRVTALDADGNETPFSSQVSATPNAIPVISGFSPESGSAGTTVTITGSNFNPVPAANVVYFGATKASVISAGSTSLSVTVPAGSTYAPITVTTGGLTAYSAKPFILTFAGGGSISSSSFSFKQDFGTDSHPYTVALADLDGDGRSDMITANSGANTVSIYRNTGTAGSLSGSSFASKVDLAAGNYPFGVAAADVNGDGKPDLVVSNDQSNSISVFRNKSVSGSLTADSFGGRVDFTVGASPNGIAVSDLDGDGRPDIVSANYADGTISVLRNTCTGDSIDSGSFAARVDFTSRSYAVCVAISDIDGDGKRDITATSTGSASSYIFVFRNTSTRGVINSGSFAAGVIFQTGGGPFGVTAGDADLDGKPDLEVANWYSTNVSVLRNISSSGVINSSSFAPQVGFASIGYPVIHAMGDLDGDGRPDMAVPNYTSNKLVLFRNNSAPGVINGGSFAVGASLNTGVFPYNAAIGDLDGDAKPDMAVVNFSDNTVSVYRNVMGEIHTQIRIFPEGAYQAGGSLKLNLRAAGFVPLKSPYGDSLRVASIPDSVTDWVSVELCSLATGPILSQKSFFLKANGNILDTTGASVDLHLQGITAGNYHIIVRHRNHLAVMTASKQALDGIPETYDFTTGLDRYYGSNGAKQLESGIWGMWAGDVNQDDNVTTTDYTSWYNSARLGESGYKATDINMDGVVTTSDYTIWYNNARLGAASQVP